MISFRNLNADFEILTQPLGPRSTFNVTGVIILVLKGIDRRHVCAKYERFTSISKGAVINFRNLKAEFET